MGDEVSIIEGATEKLESLQTAVAKKTQETSSHETAFEVAQFILENLLSSLFVRSPLKLLKASVNRKT
jgi:hypothetical protein